MFTMSRYFCECTSISDLIVLQRLNLKIKRQLLAYVERCSKGNLSDPKWKQDAMDFLNCCDSEIVDSIKAPPASKKAIRNLVQKKVVVCGDQCSICLKNFNVRELTTVMPCKHLFHSACLHRWLKKTNSCPICRHELATGDASYDIYAKQKLKLRKLQQKLNERRNSVFT